MSVAVTEVRRTEVVAEDKKEMVIQQGHMIINYFGLWTNLERKISNRLSKYFRQPQSWQCSVHIPVGMFFYFILVFSTKQQYFVCLVCFSDMYVNMSTTTTAATTKLSSTSTHHSSALWKYWHLEALICFYYYYYFLFYLF